MTKNKYGLENSMDSTLQIEPKQVSFPKSIFFIITNEFCERFCYYGMKTVLSLYLTDVLLYSTDQATVLYHSWAGLCYFFPLFGGILADTFLGKFRTIVYLSIIYLLGNVLLSVVSISDLHLPQRLLSIIGLLLIALGTGGIKPCVSSFGGDQFILPQQALHLARFFSFFYFSINAGSLISTFITPVFRNDIQCFGETTCFPLAFGVPALLMLVSIVVFVAGRPIYRINDPKGNIFVTVIKCMKYALSSKSRTPKNERDRGHWLDYADDKYSPQIIEDIKILLRVLVLFIPIPLFWALFDQQGSRWTFQANRMDGYIPGTSFSIKPDQMQVINPLLILAFIPLFQYVVYPVIAKCGISTPLRKLTLGGFLAAIAFVVSAGVEIEIRDHSPAVLGSGFSTIRVYNTIPCNFQLESSLSSNTLPSLGMAQYEHIATDGNKSFSTVFTPNPGCQVVTKSLTGNLIGSGGKNISYYLTSDKGEAVLKEMGEDLITRSTIASSKVRVLFYPALQGKVLTFESTVSEKSFKTNVTLSNTELFSTYIDGFSSGTYNVLSEEKELAQISVRKGGVYVLNIQEKGFNLIEIVPTEIHMLWLLPQYIIITAAEIMFSITGLEFAFTQAPKSMKSVLSAAWLLTVAIGNMIVVVVAESKFFDNQAYEFLLFAGLMVLDMLIFAVLALKYQYVIYKDEEEDDDKGQINEAMSPQQKS